MLGPISVLTWQKQRNTLDMSQQLLKSIDISHKLIRISYKGTVTKTMRFYMDEENMETIMNYAWFGTQNH